MCGRGTAHAIAGIVLILVAACVVDEAEPEGPPPIEAVSPSGQPTPTPERGPVGSTRITVDDNGATLSMAVGEMATLVLEAPVTADPSLSSEAARLVAIMSFAESAVQEWEVHAVQPGTAELRAEDGRGRRLAVVILVSGE